MCLVLRLWLGAQARFRKLSCCLADSQRLLSQHAPSPSTSFEQHLSINHLGSFLFTNLTLPKICGAKEGRIIAVASSATIISPFRFSDPEADKTAKDVPEPKKSGFAKLEYPQIPIDTEQIACVS